MVFDTLVLYSPKALKYTLFQNERKNEPLDIDQNEEYGQKRKCPPGPLFWGTVCPNLT